MYVVLHHAWFDVFWTGGASRWPAWLTSGTFWMNYGQHAVVIFIVLSGFCLGLPLVRCADRGPGIWRFACRRGRRILPPYYAAIIFSIVLVVCIPMMRRISGDRWDHALPVGSVSAIASHVLLLHNLSPATAWRIDPPMWSVATEWQIYFIFALLLAPVYRRLGVVATVAMAVSVGLLPHLYTSELDPACPWFLGLFALGIAAAHVSFSSDAISTRCRAWRGWRWLSLTFSIAYAINLIVIHQMQSLSVLTDFAVGGLTAIAIIDWTRATRRSESRLGLRILNSRLAQLLGRFSYSLYLIHFPILALAHRLLVCVGVEPVSRLVVMMLVAVPMAVGVSYCFYVCFEKPFTRRRASAASTIPPVLIRTRAVRSQAA